DRRGTGGASARIRGGAAAAEHGFHGSRGNRRGAPRAAPRRGVVVRCRGPHAPDREPMDRACAKNVPDHQWLVVDGLWTAGGDREPPAHYFGVPAVGVSSAEALEAAVKTALARNGPTVIEAVVDSEHYIETVYD